MIEHMFESRFEGRPGDRRSGRLCRDGTDIMETAIRLYGWADQARLARLEAVAELDRSGGYSYDGYTSTTTFLTHRCGLGSGEAKRELFLARSLEEMTYAVKLVGTGRLTLNQLEVLAYARSRHPESFREDEPNLSEAVSGLGLADTRRAVDYWVQAHDEPESASEPEPSRVFLSRTWKGRGRLDGDLDAETCGILSEALDGLMSEVVDSTPKAELADAPVRRAEALKELARRHLDSPDSATDHGNRPHLSVHIDWEVLTGRSRSGVCELGDGTVISPETAQRLACDARVCRLLTGPAGEILELGRSVRTVSAAQYRALRIRDRHCRFPGCRRPSSWCDAHHLRPWHSDGPTDLDNLILLCRHHHTLIHRAGWKLTGPPATPVFTRPDGTTLPNAPP